jgi:hypothetical protein
MRGNLELLFKGKVIYRIPLRMCESKVESGTLYITPPPITNAEDDFSVDEWRVNADVFGVGKVNNFVRGVVGTNGHPVSCTKGSTMTLTKFYVEVTS